MICRIQKRRRGGEEKRRHKLLFSSTPFLLFCVAFSAISASLR
jgi:hypothetical protein